MSWLLELLIDGLREICSQFVIDMMDLITGMFTELLSCDLTLFEELFSVVGDLYKNVMVPMGIAILLLIWIWQLFKSMFGKAGVSSEDPIELVCRSCIALFFVVAAKPMINYVLNIAGTPYQWVVGTEITVESFSEYVSVLENVTGSLGIGSLNISILMLIMQFVVAWNYLKMLFIIAERYVLLGVFSYTAPLAFSTGGSKATNNILASWSKMFGGQIVLIILNAWCMKMFLSGYGNLMASSYGFTKFFVATLCLIGFCKITFKLDSYMASLGVNLGRPSYGLGAMGLMMAAGRILSHIGRGSSGATENGSSSGAETGVGASGNANMPEASAGPIPMSVGMGDESMDMDNMPHESGFGDETESQADMTAQDDFMPDNMEDAGVLEELGMMPADIGAEENADTGINEESGFSEESGMNVESGEVPGYNEGSEFLGEENETGSGMPEAGFGDETNILGDMGDYPVEEDFDGEVGPEMDLEGGSIESAGMETEGVTYGSAASYSGGGLSNGGSLGAKTSDDAGVDTIGEMGGETTVSGFESYDTGGETIGAHSSDGHTFERQTSDGMNPGAVRTSMESEFGGSGLPDYEISDEGNEMGIKVDVKGHMNNLDTGRTIPPAEEKFQRTKAGSSKKSFREVPRSREELRRRKQGNSGPDQNDSKHKI